MSKYPAASAIKVPNQGPPPDSFISALVSFGTITGRYVAAVNSNQDDIMGIIRPILAPSDWTGIEQRLAGLLTALLYDAGFESSWNFGCGVDMEPGAGTSRPANEWEAGAWQVSQNSINKDVPFKAMGSLGTLSALVGAYCNGATGPTVFQAAMKTNHLLAIQYAAWLFRFNTNWSGPCDSGDLTKAMTDTDNGATAIAAMVEIQGLIAQGA